MPRLGVRAPLTPLNKELKMITIICEVTQCKHNKEGVCFKEVLHISFGRFSEYGPECDDYSEDDKKERY